ncbi:hypothetical protein R3P38DRAFT_2790980 [Favolaschia claudopus]|uniref:Uncharacterized protein n=1 Tax=Favolaschia claudopus TaxID=2862362 RepID=A0AAW0AH29_9AGAR
MTPRPFVGRRGLPVVPVLLGTATSYGFPILSPDSFKRFGIRAHSDELLDSNPAIDSNTHPMLQTSCVQSGTFLRWGQPCSQCLIDGTGATCTFTNRLKFVEVLESRRSHAEQVIFRINPDPVEAYRGWEVQFFADCQAAFYDFNKCVAPFDKQRLSLRSQVEAIQDFPSLCYLHMLFDFYEYPADVKALVIQRMEGMKASFGPSAVEDCMVQEIVRLSLYSSSQAGSSSSSK